MTPAQLRHAADAESERLEHEYQTAINVAWHCAAFERAKRLPDLKELMRRGRKPVKRLAVDEAGLKSFMLAHNARIRREKAKNGKTR